MAPKVVKKIGRAPAVQPKLMVGFITCPSFGKKDSNISGWWFGTFFIVPYIGNSHPN